MIKDEIVEYWVASAEQDFNTMDNLYKSKDYQKKLL